MVGKGSGNLRIFLGTYSVLNLVTLITSFTVLYYIRYHLDDAAKIPTEGARVPALSDRTHTKLCRSSFSVKETPISACKQRSRWAWSRGRRTWRTRWTCSARRGSTWSRSRGSTCRCSCRSWRSRAPRSPTGRSWRRSRRWPSHTHSPSSRSVGRVH